MSEMKGKCGGPMHNFKGDKTAALSVRIVYMHPYVVVIIALSISEKKLSPNVGSFDSN